MVQILFLAAKFLTNSSFFGETYLGRKSNQVQSYSRFSTIFPLDSARAKIPHKRPLITSTIETIRFSSKAFTKKKTKRINSIIYSPHGHKINFSSSLHDTKIFFVSFFTSSFDSTWHERKIVVEFSSSLTASQSNYNIINNSKHPYKTSQKIWTNKNESIVLKLFFSSSASTLNFKEKKILTPSACKRIFKLLSFHYHIEIILHVFKFCCVFFRFYFISFDCIVFSGAVWSPKCVLCLCHKWVNYILSEEGEKWAVNKYITM